ncbi:MAG: enoyl-CoA hydratase-related protein [Planctomycetota bacterium]
MGVIEVEREGGVARVWLNRPDVHNAFNAEVIAGLDETLTSLGSDTSLRAIVLGGRGRSFSAGADLNWMIAAADLSQEDNARDAAKLAGMLRRLSELPQATIARVHGTALGGGLGLLSACDLALGVERAKFGFSEARLGLIPAVISPHCVARIGPAKARALFVTGRRIDAQAALACGLLDEVLPDDAALDAAVDQALADVLACAPGAVAACKTLVARVAQGGSAAEVDAFTAAQIAARRASEEGREGIAAFLGKRPPSWGAAD